MNEFRWVNKFEHILPSLDCYLIIKITFFLEAHQISPTETCKEPAHIFQTLMYQISWDQVSGSWCSCVMNSQSNIYEVLVEVDEDRMLNDLLKEDNFY